MAIDSTIGVNALSTLIKNTKNVGIIERSILKYSKNDNNIYLTVLYQVVDDLTKNVPIKDILNSIREENVLWKHNIFNSIRNRINEQDDFIIHPFEVAEGILTCNKCGGNRTFSYSA